MLLSLASLLIFVGTYTPNNGSSQGIYAVPFDPATGVLGQPTLAAETPNPTFLAWHPTQPVLYALNESGQIGATPGGAALAFTYDPATGSLNRLQVERTGGGGCAHLGVDPAGRALVMVSYAGGQIASLPLDPAGRPQPVVTKLSQAGSPGPIARRQDKSHPHSVTFSPDARFAYVCDLGLDRIFRYRIDPATAGLALAGETAAKPGAGPRHSKFSADGKFFYVINELNSTVAVYAVADDGDLTERQSVSTLPSDYKDRNTTAEIRLSPDGRFVYGSNRGHDSLAVFARDAANGTLTPVEIVPCGGKHPRNFNLSPDGRWLVCANRDSNNLAVFRIDPVTGRLSATGQTVTVPLAVCVVFAPEK